MLRIIVTSASRAGLQVVNPGLSLPVILLVKLLDRLFDLKKSKYNYKTTNSLINTMYFEMYKKFIIHNL
jgi:hypothetical protein